jgi:DNA primase
MDEALDELQLYLPNNHKLECPAHDETIPSLHVYEDSWYCFSCGRNGDGIGLVALYTEQDVRSLVAQRGGGWHSKRVQTRGLTKQEVARAVYRRYQDTHNWWFQQINLLYTDVPDWLLLRKLDLWSQAFDELRDRLLGHNGFEDDGPLLPFQAEPLIDEFRVELEQAIQHEQEEAKRYKVR